MLIEKRPCHELGSRPNACAAAFYEQVVHNRVALSGPWQGWRLAGRDLITPDRQRISPERLRGLLFREEAERRLALRRAEKSNGSEAGRVTALPARESFEGCA